MGYYYESFLRPDAHPETAMFIHTTHVHQMFGIIPTRNVLSMEFFKVAKDLKSSVDFRHILQDADSLTCVGSLIGLRSNNVHELNDDLMTQVSYRSGFRELTNSARLSRKANKRAETTRKFIALPFNSGTEIFKENDLPEGFQFDTSMATESSE
jgi:hypothetical protein